MSKTKNTIDELKQLRDEIRVKMHLGEMEVKEWWGQVEPQLIALESNIADGANKASESSGIVLDEFVEAFRRIRDKLGNS